MSGGFAAILARLRAPQLRHHCDDALTFELMQVQHQVEDVRAAMQRLRDVAKAAHALGTDDAAVATSDTTLVEMERTQRALGRAVAAFGGQQGAAYAPTLLSSYVCRSCGRLETEEREGKEAPLLAEPDTAALSPPKRRKPTPHLPKRKKSLKQKPTVAPRRKLVVPRRPSPVREEDHDEADATVTTTPVETEPSTPKKENPRAQKEEQKVESTTENDDVVVVEDESDSEGDEVDVRARLQRHIDACWPLATRLGALEMPHRRRADYIDLVRRVRPLFRTLVVCAVDDVASRSMRSVLVKARDSLAVAVSLLSLHDVTDTNAAIILALVKAVDAASAKHATLQKQVAPFRNSLADFEVALLTRSYATPQMPTKQETKATRKKPRTGR